ncbi:MAG TPA: hypothetical protein VFE25_12865 [Opitutaceae bacterium]|nr:hypothetical protein [Opitutaceae bacterium]
MKAWVILTLVGLLALGGPGVSTRSAPHTDKERGACGPCGPAKAPCSPYTNCSQACPLSVTLGILAVNDGCEAYIGSESMSLDPFRRAGRVCCPPPVPPPRVPVC